MGVYSIDKLMNETRKLAAEFRRATGQPLPVSGELANYDAARLLGLQLNQTPQTGFDAVGQEGEREGLKFQIKGRAIFDEKKGGQRIGQLKLEQPWDRLVLVLMDENFEPTRLYEADREAVAEAVKDAPANKRGAMSVARFKAIAQLVWEAGVGAVEDEPWEHPGA